MKKTMFKRIFAGIAAMFMMCMFLPMCSMEFMPNAKPNTEAEDEWLDMYGIEYKIKDRDTLIINDNSDASIELYDFYFETYAADIKHLQIGKGWKIINFNYLTAIESLTIGDICTIREDAFRDCAALTSVKIGECCMIGERAFLLCTSLTNVTMGNECMIGERAFPLCTSLTNVTMGNGCTIGENAFWECTSLTNVTMGYYCTIKSMAFGDCNSIQKVFCIGDKNTVTVDEHNPRIICNKDKWITATKCTKCQGPVIDYICEFCGYFDETTVKAEIEANEAEIKQKQERNAYLKSILNEQETQSETEPPTTIEEGNPASTFSDGSVLVIVGGSTFLILCGLAAVIIVKKRKKTE